MGNDLGDALNASDLSQCIDLCMSRGIECMGVTFAFDSQLCRLKKTMISNGNSGSELQSAIRIARPVPRLSSTQLLVNGDFVTDYSPWVDSSAETSLSSLMWKNGAA
jgi:hypothetical protein